MGYSFLFSDTRSAAIDLDRLIVQWIVVAIATAGFVFLVPAGIGWIVVIQIFFWGATSYFAAGLIIKLFELDVRDIEYIALLIWGCIQACSAIIARRKWMQANQDETG